MTLAKLRRGLVSLLIAAVWLLSINFPMQFTLN